jgi:hypothetical protein
MPPVEQASETVLVPIADARLLLDFASFPDKRREIDELKAVIEARDRVAAALGESDG